MPGAENPTGYPIPLPVNKGGTNAVTAAAARANLGLTVYIVKGDYDGGTPYVLGDVVLYTDGKNYAALGDTMGNLPTDTDYWEQVAFAGKENFVKMSVSGVDFTQGDEGQEYATGSIEILAIETFATGQIEIIDNDEIHSVAISATADTTITDYTGLIGKTVTVDGHDLVEGATGDFLASINEVTTAASLLTAIQALSGFDTSTLDTATITVNFTPGVAGNGKVVSTTATSGITVGSPLAGGFDQTTVTVNGVTKTCGVDFFKGISDGDTTHSINYSADWSASGFTDINSYFTPIVIFASTTPGSGGNGKVISTNCPAGITVTTPTSGGVDGWNYASTIDITHGSTPQGDVPQITGITGATIADVANSIVAAIGTFYCVTAAIDGSNPAKINLTSVSYGLIANSIGLATNVPNYVTFSDTTLLGGVDPTSIHTVFIGTPTERFKIEKMLFFIDDVDTVTDPLMVVSVGTNATEYDDHFPVQNMQFAVYQVGEWDEILSSLRPFCVSASTGIYFRIRQGATATALTGTVVVTGFYQPAPAM